MKITNKLASHFFVLFLVFMPFVPASASASAWMTNVVSGIDVYDIDSASSTWDDVVSDCSTLGVGGRVPTVAELDLMFTDKVTLGLSDITYWGSEIDTVNSYSYDMTTGMETSSLKSASFPVRCVRNIQLFETSQFSGIASQVEDLLTIVIPIALGLFAIGLALRYGKKVLVMFK